MSIEFHDPRGNSRVAAEAYVCRHTLGAGTTVGLLANGFPDSEVFLEAVDAALQRELPDITTRHYNKHGASVPADDAMVSRIASECDVLVTAYGH